MSTPIRRSRRVPSPAKQNKKSPKNSISLRPTQNRLPYYLKPGSAVEISSDEPGFRGSWYPGTVIAAPSADKNTVRCQVEYTSIFFDEGGKKRLREVVKLTQLRPPPPPMSEREKNRDITVGEEVDAYHNDGWWEGNVTEVLENGEFSVFFKSSKEQIRFSKNELRFHREWLDEAWKPPLDEEAEEEESEEDDSEEEEDIFARVDPETTRAIANQIFTIGTLVEVSSDEEGFKGSWFVAKVIEPISKDKYLIEYRDLREENGIEPLKEETDYLHIRPPPPSDDDYDDDVDFVVGDKIDAFYNDGWWVGVVIESIQGGSIGVRFKHSGEKMRFGRKGLRLHRDWINGTWQLPLKGGKIKRAKIFPCNRNVRPKKVFEKQEFSIGTLVEVSSEEEGFEDSWFPARVLEYRGTNKCFVEYDHLKGEDGKESLKEEVNVSLIRPQPPERIMVNRFEKHDKVNALYNDGWWVGEITKVLAKSYYTVYFNKTQELLKFHHSQLRLHQEWIDGKWLTSSSKEQRVDCFRN